MDYRFAVVTSPDEVENYFTGKRWAPLTGPSKFERNIHDGIYNIRLTPGQEMFEVSIEAMDDPSDSERTEEPTTDPMGFVSKFLRQDGVGDLSRVSFDPNHLARKLRQISTQELRSIERVLRRAILLVADQPVIRVAAADGLLSEIKKKGWEIEEENEREIVVIISDAYRATFRSMGVEWEYQFEVQDTESATVHGKTQDPIIKYREWYKKENTVNAVRQTRTERAEKKRVEDEARDSQETVRPVKKKPVEEADTESP